MNRMAMSRAATALMRALIARSGAPRDRILLSDARSTDWQSLTFTGERHQLHFRVCAPHSEAFARKMCAGLEDAEFSIPGLIVADIAVIGRPRTGLDGSTSVAIEALTIAAD
jgi:hypothetical protein